MGTITVNEDWCKGCALCTVACNLELIRLAPHFNPKGYHPAILYDEQQRCTGCTLCARVCPDAAIEVYR